MVGKINPNPNKIFSPGFHCQKMNPQLSILLLVLSFSQLSFGNYFYLSGTLGELASDAQEHTSKLYFKTAQKQLLSISIKHQYNLP